MSRPPLVFEGTSCPPSNSPRDLTVMAVDPAATGTSPDGNPDGDSWSWSARWWSQPSWDWSADDATWWTASADWSSSAAERACWPPASWFEDAHMEPSVAASVPAPHPTEGPPKRPPPELPSSILFLFIETSLVFSFTSLVMLLVVCVSGRCLSAFHGSNFFLLCSISLGPCVSPEVPATRRPCSRRLHHAATGWIHPWVSFWRRRRLRRRRHRLYQAPLLL